MCHPYRKQGLLDDALEMRDVEIEGLTVMESVKWLYVLYEISPNLELLHETV